MSMEEVKVKVEAHDRSLEMVAMAIEDLAAAAGLTNNKLDKVVEALGMQSVIIERLNNMDNNIADSFKRRDERLNKLEDMQVIGCSPLKVSEENVKSLGRSVDTLRIAIEKGLGRSDARVDSIETKIGTFISGAVVRWAIGITVTVMLVLGAVDRTTHENARVSRDKLWDRLDAVSADLKVQSTLNSQTAASVNSTLLELRNNTADNREAIVQLRVHGSDGIK